MTDTLRDEIPDVIDNLTVQCDGCDAEPGSDHLYHLADALLPIIRRRIRTEADKYIWHYREVIRDVADAVCGADA